MNVTDPMFYYSGQYTTPEGRRALLDAGLITPRAYIESMYDPPFERDESRMTFGEYLAAWDKADAWRAYLARIPDHA